MRIAKQANGVCREKRGQRREGREAGRRIAPARPSPVDITSSISYSDVPRSSARFAPGHFSQPDYTGLTK